MQKNKTTRYWTEDINLEWYKRQFREPYRITVAFRDFLKQNINIKNDKILDIGCGTGSALDYIAKAYPDAVFTGLDINSELFEMYEGSAQNIHFRKGDCFALDDEIIDMFDGVISLQTLSWLPEWRTPLKEICKIRPRWIAVSSLFYPGKINYTISLENYERPAQGANFSQVYYNVYSVPLIKEQLEQSGYNRFVYQPFVIDIDIKKPEHYDLGYYTIRDETGKRMAFNTCLFQPEGFIFASLE